MATIQYYNEGDKIIYTYEHSLNSKSRVMRSKEGVYVRRINKRGFIKGTPNAISNLVVVKLKGNKGNSIVPRTSITHSTLNNEK